MKFREYLNENELYFEIPKNVDVKWKKFSSMDSEKEDFGAEMVNFYGSLGWDSVKVKKNVDATLKVIKKGALDQLKDLTRKK